MSEKVHLTGVSHEEMWMESYIVRVIRRDQAECSKRWHMEGVVEGVECRGRQPFHSAAELWAILVGTCKAKSNDLETTKEEE